VQEISDGEELFASPEIALHPNAGHRERLRARFLKSGAGSLPDYELLELTLFAAIPAGIPSLWPSSFWPASAAMPK
jgi:hypothetical protein